MKKILKKNPKLMKNFKYIYIFGISFFWIILLLYFRFFRERKGYTLDEWRVNITFLGIIITICICFLHLVLIFLAIRSIFLKVNENKKRFFIIEKFKYYMFEIKRIIFSKPLEGFRDIIAPHIPYSGITFCKFTEFFKDKPEFSLKLITFFFNNMPRLIVSFIFFIDIVFYNQIYFFIKSLLLLFIPILWNIFLDLYIDFAQRTLNVIPKNVEVIPLGDPLPNGWHTDYAFKPYPQFIYEDSEIKEYKELWFLCMIMLSFGHGSMKNFQKSIMPYMTIITSSCYLCASILKLLFILFLI